MPDKGKRALAVTAKLDWASRRATALSLRRNGHEYKTIGLTLGISTARAHQLVKAELDSARRTSLEDADAIRQLELLRLDALTKAVWDDAMQGETKSVEALLKIMERRARYLGIESPTPVEPASVVLAAFIATAERIYGDSEAQRDAPQEGDNE